MVTKSESGRESKSNLMAYLLSLGLLAACCAVLLASADIFPPTRSPQDGSLSQTKDDLMSEHALLMDNKAMLQHKWKLKIDEALLKVNGSHLDEEEQDLVFTLKMQYEVCHNCSLMEKGDITREEPLVLKVSSQFPSTLLLYKATNLTEPHCTEDIHFDEHVEYTWYISPRANSCKLMYGSSFDAFIPIYVALGSLFFLALMYGIVRFLIRSQICQRIRDRKTEALVDSDLGRPSTFIQENINSGQEQVRPPSKRLKSLDTFRGFALIIMIFVNYGGGQYWFFHHAAWNGLTVADLVFPWFVFIMGTSIALAFRTLISRNTPRKYIALKVVKRTAILFFLGLVIGNFDKGRGGVDVQTLRVLGVLQRLALTYFLIAMLEVCFAKRYDEQLQYRKWSSIRDIVPYWMEWLAIFAVITLHTCLTFLLPLDHDCPTGYLGAGGFQDGGANENCTGGAAGYIDRLILGANHMYDHPTCKKWYFSADTEKVAYDPEGLLGTLTSAVICFLGLQAGRIIIVYDHWKSRVVRFFIWFLITGLIAGILCKFSQNDGWIPLNKNLWSLSFVLALSSFAFILLLVFYLVIDVFGIWTGTPFYYPGMNSIAIYLCHEIFEHYFPIRFKVPETHASQLALDIYGAAIWVILAIILHHKNIFIAI